MRQTGQAMRLLNRSRTQVYDSRMALTCLDTQFLAAVFQIRQNDCFHPSDRNSSVQASSTWTVWRYPQPNGKSPAIRPSSMIPIAVSRKVTGRIPASHSDLFHITSDFCTLTLHDRTKVGPGQIWVDQNLTVVRRIIWCEAARRERKPLWEDAESGSKCSQSVHRKVDKGRNCSERDSSWWACSKLWPDSGER